MIYGYPSLSVFYYAMQGALLSGAFIQLHTGPIEFEPDEILAWG